MTTAAYWTGPAAYVAGPGFAVHGAHDWLFLLAAVMFAAVTVIAVVAVPERVTKLLFALIGLGMMFAALARLFTG